MIYCAYVRVSTDTQDVARQENEIKKWLGDTDHQVIWFKEQGVAVPQSRCRSALHYALARRYKARCPLR